MTVTLTFSLETRTRHDHGQTRITAGTVGVRRHEYASSVNMQRPEVAEVTMVKRLRHRLGVP
eukprot:1871675-Rhodomonas_salina.1